jgi:hypothetical protein
MITKPQLTKLGSQLRWNKAERECSHWVIAE